MLEAWMGYTHLKIKSTSDELQFQQVRETRKNHVQLSIKKSVFPSIKH